MKYGIRALTTYWHRHNIGGDDFIGTQEEMKTVLKTLKNIDVHHNTRFTVIPYIGNEGKPPPFPSQPENPRNSRMKR